ncbi:MAG: mannose-1-phosphate guanylyltransferase, partial [Bacteroidaceae bacterium]|nr:mannose-1-phosphate guanylyltransferase [Bacteroidaceae bacterium]
PCIAYASWRIKKRNPQANIIVSPSDHVVLDTQEFRRIIGECTHFVNENDSIVVLGIKPTRPETGFGYIQTDESVPSSRNRNIYRVDRFREKPDLQTAQSYIAQNCFYWNAGIFVWNVNTIVNALRIYAKEISDIFESLLPVLGTEEEQAAIDEAYSACPAISIDYAVMEKAEDIFCYPSDFGWSDMGTWGALSESSSHDANGNTLIGNVKAFDTRNCIVHTQNEKKVIIQGLDGYIVAECDNQLLICRLSEEQHIKDYIEEN